MKHYTAWTAYRDVVHDSVPQGRKGESRGGKQCKGRGRGKGNDIRGKVRGNKVMRENLCIFLSFLLSL